MTWQYAADVGTPSYPDIINAAKLSNLYGPDPDVRDTNDYDNPAEGGGGYHATKNAVDFGDDSPLGSVQMDAFAAWVAAALGPYSLEIIHVNRDGTTVEWKFGDRMPTGWYGADTLAQHHNHVHWAITESGLTAGLAALHEGELIMDAEAKAAFDALNAKIDQANFQQMYGAAGKPNPLGLVGQTDIFSAVQTHGGWLLKLLQKAGLKP